MMNTRTTWLVLAALAMLAGVALSGWFRFSDAPQTEQRREAAAVGPRLSVEHAQGTSVVPLSPRRVVAFDLRALDVLDALGVDVIGVAGHDFPAYLRGYADSRYLNLGTLFEPDFEAVNAAHPDLIITGSRSSAKYTALARLAATIDLPTENTQPVRNTFANTRLLAGIFGRETEAEALIADTSESLAALRAKTRDRGRGLIVLVTGGKLSAYGPGSRFGVLHSDFGVPPAAPDLDVSLHGEAIGSEFILKTNPDWLFVIDRDVAIGETGAARQVLDNPLVRQTTAWQKGQVVYLDPATWYLVGEGIQALRAMIEQVDESYGPTQP